MILSGYCIVLFKYEDEFGGLPDTDKHLTLILRPNPNTAKSLPSHWAQSVAGSEIKRNMNGLLLRGPAICLSSLKFTQHFHNHFYPSKFFRSTSYPKCNCIKNKDTQIVPEGKFVEQHGFLPIQCACSFKFWWLVCYYQHTASFSSWSTDRGS